MRGDRDQQRHLGKKIVEEEFPSLAFPFSGHHLFTTFLN